MKYDAAVLTLCYTAATSNVTGEEGVAELERDILVGVDATRCNCVLVLGGEQPAAGGQQEDHTAHSEQCSAASAC